MYARVATIRFPPELREEVVSVIRDSVLPVLRKQRGFGGLMALTEPDEGIIVFLWETEADAEAGEASSVYRDVMSRLASFLYGKLAPATYRVSVQA